ncbi:hypothetical protein [Photobacterium sp. GJ3]|uniref:hypothetical protein n=1 Tax=Photobacterium sp. GJ3 TaxID=2829502 RepID=UPI00353043F7
MADIRRQNDGAAVARMLLATSLARQEPLRQALHIQPVPVHYICGARIPNFPAWHLRRLSPSRRLPVQGTTHIWPGQQRLHAQSCSSPGFRTHQIQ